MMIKIFKNGMGIFLFVAILFSAFVVFSFLPIPGNISILTVFSGSMEPEINTGGLVFVKPANVYGVGDVVTRRTNEGDVTITHRIIGQSESDGVIYFQTQGDANSVADEGIFPSDMVIGKVVFDIPYMGYLVHFARTTQGLILLIIIPAIIIAYEEVGKIKKEIKKMSTSRKRESSQEQDDLMTAELCAQFVEPAIVRTHNKPKKIIKIV